MAKNLDDIIKHWIGVSNKNIKIAFPAVVVGVEKLSDGFVDVRPVVNYVNPINNQTSEYPVICEIPLVFPSTKNSSICFPVNQGDFVELVIQSVDIQKFIDGNGELHNPDIVAYNNLDNAVAFVGFSPYQQSCFNPNNYSNDFDNQDLNIVHNKNTSGEVSIHLKSSGDIEIKSPTKVTIESKSVEVVSENVSIKSPKIETDGDFVLAGKSLKTFMSSHTHIGNQGSPTSTPQGL